METIAWIGFSQSLFAAILMGAKKDRSASDKILAAWMCLLAFEFLTCALDYGFFGNSLMSSSFLLFNPAFYLYVVSLTNEHFKLRWIQVLHLLPYFFFEIAVYVIQQPMNMAAYFESDTSLWFRAAFTGASVASWIIYNTLSAILVVKHRRRLENEFSTIESNKRIGWLLFIVVFYNLYCGFALIIGATSVLLDTNIPVLTFFNYSTLLLLIYILGFYGLRQTTIFEMKEEVTVEERYAKSPLSLQRKQEIKERLLEHFKAKKPYLNPDLNMSMLSGQLNIPKHQLTEVLNVDLGKNFFQFVNEYRVEAVKKQLARKNNPYTIEAIGYECGFNSKSSFYTVFKEMTGQTPMGYRLKLED